MVRNKIVKRGFGSCAAWKMYGRQTAIHAFEAHRLCALPLSALQMVSLCVSTFHVCFVA